MYDKERFGYVQVSFKKGGKKAGALAEGMKPFRHLYPVDFGDRIEYRGLMRIRDAKRVHRYILKHPDGDRYKATIDGDLCNSKEAWKRWLKGKRALA